MALSLSTHYKRKTSRSHEERVMCRTVGTVTIEHTESWSDVIIDGRKVHLSPSEARVLKSFVDCYGEPLSIETVLNNLGMGVGSEEKRLAARHVRNLRGKLAPHGFHILHMREYEAYLFLYHL